MSRLSRGEALSLIQATIFQFHRDVMQPLNASIPQGSFAEEQTNAERLNNQFFAFSQAVGNWDNGISTKIAGWDNFRLSQLLSLCRDISELYNLNVYAKMPSFIADDNLLDADPEDPEPLRYVAPGVTRGVFRSRRTRARPHRDAELAFAREVLGPIGERAYKNSVIRRLPGRGANMDSGLSIPLFGIGKIWLGGNIYGDPLLHPWTRNLFIHEVFHQVQYIQGVLLTRLAWEVLRHNLPGSFDAYDYDLNVSQLSDLPNYEAQAALVGDFAEDYYAFKYAGNFHARPSDPRRIRNKDTIIRMAQIMESSGFISTATRHIRTLLEEQEQEQDYDLYN